MFDIIGKRRWFYAFSLLLTIPGLIFILISPFSDAGLQLTIDYTGGTRWEIKFEDPNVSPDQVEEVFAANDLRATAIRTESGFIEIKTEPIGLTPAPVETPAPSGSPVPSGSVAPGGSPTTSGSPAPSASSTPTGSAEPSASPGASASPSASPSAAPIGNTELPTDGKLGEMVTALETSLGKIESQRSLTTIGAVVSSDLLRQALILIVVGSLGIVAWITYRFRDVKFGVSALISLVHDVIVVVGAFAILGTFFHVEIDALFVTAMLTIIGFSVHDTIVVFDRIRENKARHLGEPFDEIVNHSILQTFGRSITTSLTVIITLLALFLFGGSAISDFILALLIGIIIGTYSSIFVASPLVVDWQAREDRQHGRITTARAPRARRAAP
ncbi:MAG: protein translocase subunit SecF [Candidatus Limnocylindrales bacterium]